VNPDLIMRNFVAAKRKLDAAWTAYRCLAASDVDYTIAVANFVAARDALNALEGVPA
jgi:hypothetical protein